VNVRVSFPDERRRRLCRIELLPFRGADGRKEAGVSTRSWRVPRTLWS